MSIPELENTFDALAFGEKNVGSKEIIDLCTKEAMRIDELTRKEKDIGKAFDFAHKAQVLREAVRVMNGGNVRKQVNKFLNL